MVLTRAMSRRVSRTFSALSSWPIAFWKRSLKSCSESSLAFVLSSSSESSRTLPGFTLSLPAEALHEPGLDVELVGRQPQRLARLGLRDPLNLEQDPPGLDHGHPELGRAHALAHARLLRLLGHRLVGEQPDPDAAVPLAAAV